MITKLMKEHFPKIVNIKFTAQVESELDEVEHGKEEWTQQLHTFYDEFSDTLKKAKEAMDGVKIQLEEDKTDIICELCGRQMVVKTGRYGKFIACPGYPECKNIKKIINETGAECPKCGGRVIVKKTKKGEREVNIRPQIYRMEARPDHVIFLQIATGSAANLKPDAVLRAYAESRGETLGEFALMVTRLEVYADKGTEESHQFVTLDSFGENIE